MLKFLTTEGLNESLNEILTRNAGEITIVSPFLQLSSEVKNNIKCADDVGIKVKFIYRVRGLSDHDQNFIFSLKNKEVVFSKPLHAKCYYNDDIMIVCSLNLYEFSQRNNIEFGFLINRKDDPELFKEVKDEVDRIIGDDSYYQRDLNDYKSGSGIPVRSFKVSEQEVKPVLEQIISAPARSRHMGAYKQEITNTGTVQYTIRGNKLFKRIDDFLPDKMYLSAEEKGSNLYRVYSVSISFYPQSEIGVRLCDELKSDPYRITRFFYGAKPVLERYNNEIHISLEFTRHSNANTQQVLESQIPDVIGIFGMLLRPTQ